MRHTWTAGSPAQGRNGHTGDSPGKSYEGMINSLNHLHMRREEVAGTAQPGEKVSWGDLVRVY